MSGSPLRKIDQLYENEMKAKAVESNKNKQLVHCHILEFFRLVTGFVPTGYQVRLLLDQSQFIVARWSRQSGKSLTLAVICLYTALNQCSKVAILAPALRQSRLMISRIEAFLPRLPNQVLAGRPLKGRLQFANGSWIEAFPNNPGTVRGLTCQLLLLDEANYIENDRDLYDAIVYALLTTNGRLIATSTPGTRDSLFYDMCTNNEEYGDFSRHHVSFHDALEPNGPLKKETLEKVNRQMKGDPSRWQREMLAEFSDDEETWLSYQLIANAVDENLEYVADLDREEGMVGAK
jgi:phage FluMu gp28-like protein